MSNTADSSAYTFPHPLLADVDGFLAYGGDLDPERLILAYRFGIFPWYDKLPILWWVPKHRFVIDIQKVHIPKSMRKYLRQPIFTITVDQAFESVIHQCQKISRKNQKGTWITEEMKAAYITLHQLGIAHSVEIWQDEKLVGGLYGVGIGQIFSGESMFSKVSNASKFAVLVLAKILANKNYRFIDCQQYSKHLDALGGYTVHRKLYHNIIKENLLHPIEAQHWHIDTQFYSDL